MVSYIDPSFRESLIKNPQDRTAQDLTLINANLKSLEALSTLRDSTIRSLCKSVRYAKHEANDVLYRTGDVINCWYILLSGSVFIDGSMYLPRSGFGRRSAGQTLRMHDCLVLETSETLVIDYPRQADVDQVAVDTAAHPSSNSTTTTTTTLTTTSLSSTTIINPQQQQQQQLKSIQVPILPSNDHSTANTTYRVNGGASQPTRKSVEVDEEEEINFNTFKATAAPNVTIRNSSYKNNNNNSSLDSSTLYLLSKDITKQIELDMERSNLNEEEEEDEINLDDDDEEDDEEEEANDDEDEDDMHNRAYHEEEELSAIAINTGLIHKHHNQQQSQTRSIMINASNKTNGAVTTSRSGGGGGEQHKSSTFASSGGGGSVNTNSQADGDLLSCSSISSSKSSSLKSNVLLTPTRTTNHNVVVVHHQSSSNGASHSATSAQQPPPLPLAPPQTNGRTVVGGGNSSQFTHQFNNSTNSIASNSSSIPSSSNYSTVAAGALVNKNKKTAMSSAKSINNTSTITASTTNSINDDASEHSVQLSKDVVREILEKDPKERSDDDIDVLVEFMQNLQAFSNLTEPITRRLCACMVLGVVDKADTLVLDHNEKLDSWAVVLNGQVECVMPAESGTLKTYNVGDHFGVSPTLDEIHHQGVMRTKCDDCQFVLVKQNDYFEILNQSKENIKCYYDFNKLIMVTELRPLATNSDRTGEIVLRGIPDKLIERLVYDDNNHATLLDPTYIQDFLLTYRVFVDQPTYITGKLTEWFEKPSLLSTQITYSSPSLSTLLPATDVQLRKKIYRIVLEWITNHFNDFETNKELYSFLERFQDVLSGEKMSEQFKVLTIAISTKSKPRALIVARSKRDEQLQFSVQGGWEKGYGVFVSRVEPASKAYELGMRRGDQIIDVNGHSFAHVSLAQALDILKAATHASINLRYNPVSFNEMLLHPDKSPYRNKKQNGLPNSQSGSSLNSSQHSVNKALLAEYIQTQYQPPSLASHLNSDAQSYNQIKKSIGVILPPSHSATNQSNNSSLLSSQISTQSLTSLNNFTTTPTKTTGYQQHQQPQLNSKANPNKYNMKILGNGTTSVTNGGSTSQIKKILGRFNRKAHSKELESHVDQSAPSLKSITRSPSPSLGGGGSGAAILQHHHQSFHTSISTSSFNNNNNSSGITRNGSSHNLSINSSTSSIGGVAGGGGGHLVNNNSTSQQDQTAGSGALSQFDTSLTKLNLQDQQQFVGEHVLKIFKNDQTFKYLVVHKETSAKEVVMLALNEFSIVDDIGSNAYSLCEVSVDQDRVIKQRRLPEQLSNLAERLALNARYYLKSNKTPGGEQFLSDQTAIDELIRDSSISFLQLEPLEISAQLTLRDYCLFKSIESSEYIDYLFKKDSKSTTGSYGHAHLDEFSQLSNAEMFWVMNEVLHEPNIMKRVKVIKSFIQIAQYCKDCKNFNSLLSIISGLDNMTVTRLKETWEKVSPKYKKMFSDMKQLLDPSLNMNKYRSLLKNESIQPPIIPFFPICQKDLYFTKESAETTVDGLINFDKLRKLSRSVRSIVQMTSSSFDLTSLRDVPTPHSVIFSMFGCTNPTLLLNNSTYGGHYHQFTKLNIKADNIKKLYEESVMVRKVRHYLNQLSKTIELSEERLRMLSSNLEPSGGASGANSSSSTTAAAGQQTLRRRGLSPNSSIGGSVNSINAALNSSVNNISGGITAGHGTLATFNQTSAINLFGVQSPESYRKLLALSESTTTTKTNKQSSAVKGSVSSHQINSSVGKSATTSSSPRTAATGYPHNPPGSSGQSAANKTTVVMSPSSSSSGMTNRSMSSTQPLAKLYSLNSTDSTIPPTINSTRNGGKYSNTGVVVGIGGGGNNGISLSQQSLSVAKSTTLLAASSHGHQNGESDSGRASMASNVDQDQNNSSSSPMLQQRALILNKYLTNEQQLQLKSINRSIAMQKALISSNAAQQQQQQQQQTSNHHVNNNRKESSTVHSSSLEEEDQISAV